MKFWLRKIGARSRRTVCTSCVCQQARTFSVNLNICLFAVIAASMTLQEYSTGIDQLGCADFRSMKCTFLSFYIVKTGVMSVLWFLVGWYQTLSYVQLLLPVLLPFFVSPVLSFFFLYVLGCFFYSRGSLWVTAILMGMTEVIILRRGNVFWLEKLIHSSKFWLTFES